MIELIDFLLVTLIEVFNFLFGVVAVLFPFVVRLQWKVETGQLDKWEYEPQYFILLRSNGQRVGYLPDFKVTSGLVSWFIEVKGRMDAKSRMKIRLFREQVGELELIDAPIYTQIKNVFGGKLTPNISYYLKVLIYYLNPSL